MSVLSNPKRELIEIRDNLRLELGKYSPKRNTGSSRVDLQACKLGVIMVIAVSCVKLLSAHNSTQHTSRKHKAGVLDAVRLRLGDRKDHPLADILSGRKADVDIVAACAR